MKNLLPLALLLGLVACNEEISKGLKKSGEEKLTCEATSRRAIGIDQKHLELVKADMQGRFFDRNSFWSRLSRETRVSLNLLLNAQVGELDEKLVYQGAVLFFERYTLDEAKALVLTDKKKTIVFQALEGAPAAVAPGCGETVKGLSGIKLDRLIPASTIEQLLVCEVNGEKFNLDVYQNAIAIHLDEKIYSFTGGEVIRNPENRILQVMALDPRGQKLELTVHPDDKSIGIKLYGETRSLIGTGFCHSSAKVK